MRILDFQLEENKCNCCGCEACVQRCPHSAISMIRDDEGFYYPMIDDGRCVDCGLCWQTCQYQHPVSKCKETQIAYGGHIKDTIVLNESTSGGAFTAIVNEWCDENYVIFGAVADGINVKHAFITDKSNLAAFRRSKYSQSVIGDCYKEALSFLKSGKKVLFSGTPCQVAALRSCLNDCYCDKLLTVEVVCEGVPSPIFIEKLEKKIGGKISTLDYRYKDKNKWDFQVMYIENTNTHKPLKRDRWFNPFWSIWLNHLMSRPSCYNCLYTTTARVSDITLGDLWGVHLYCPDLYNDNKGASLLVANTERGKALAQSILSKTFEGRELDFSTALKYQGPMRKSIPMNPDRSAFMKDLLIMDYDSICKKWAKRPSLKLIISKYLWGTNRQVVKRWKIKQKYIKSKQDEDDHC